MPGGLEQSLQGAPVWYQEAARARMERAAALAKRRLEHLNVLSPAERERLEGQLAPFLALKRGPEGAVIPFSITGYSEPINLTPDEIQRIITDPAFARKIFSEATGLPKVTRGDLEDLRRRAIEEYEISRPSLGKKESISSIETELDKLRKEDERDRHELQQLKMVPESRALSSVIEERIQRRKPKIESLIPKEEPLFSSKPSFAPSHSAPSAPSALSSSSVAAPKTSRPIETIRSELEKLKVANANDRSRIESQKRRKASGRAQVMINSIENHIKEREPQIAALSAELAAASSVASSPSVPSAPSAPSVSAPAPSPAPVLSLPQPVTAPLEASREDLSDILKRASAGREIEKLLARRATIAPMNERHEQAKRMLDQSLQDATLDLAQAELMKAQKHSPLATIKPYVESSLTAPEADLDGYMNKYQKNVIDALKDESRESLLEDIIPKINSNFAQRGAFQSGARVAAIRKAAIAKDKALRREIASLLHHGYEKSMEHNQAARNRSLSAAEVMGRATKEEQEAQRAVSEHLRQQALTKHGLTHSNIAAVGQVARSQQEQAQNELAAKERQFEREQMHDWEQLARESAIASGTPVAVQNLGVSSAGPISPPNMYNLAGGALGALSGLLQQQSQRAGYAKGGSVRGHYDEGGEVPYDNDLESEIRGFMAQEDARNHQRLQEAQKHNPIMSWISHAGQAMLANPRGDPLQNLGHGLAGSLHDMEVSKERTANLYDKINASRMHQYQILAAFENQKAQRAHQKANLEATQNYRQSQLEQGNQRLQMQLAKLGQDRAFHDEKLALDMAKLEQKPKKAISGKEKDKLEAAEAEYHDLLEAKRLLEEGDPLYHPGTQILSGIRPNWTKNPDQAAFEQLASDMRGQTFKRFGYRNQAEFKNIKEIDPTLGKDQNLKIVDQRLKQVGRYIKKKEKEFGIDIGVFSRRSEENTPQINKGSTDPFAAYRVE